GPDAVVEGLGLRPALRLGRTGVDVHRAQQLALVGVEGGQLGVDVVGDVLDVVGLVGLEQQQGRRSVVGQLLLGEEVGITGGDHALGGEQAGVAVVGVQPVPLP